MREATPDRAPIANGVMSYMRDGIREQRGIGRYFCRFLEVDVAGQCANN